MKKIKVGILGATGMVGQRFIELLSNHPWFEVAVVAASKVSAGKKYHQAVVDRWNMTSSIPTHIKNLVVQSVVDDSKTIANSVDLVFSCLDMEKDEIKKIEETYASLGVAVVSNNSAHRWTKDIPMIIPEINAHHVKLIDMQKKKRKWSKGFIVVKPNCSIQSYVSVLSCLKQFGLQKVHVVSMQAISGAGKTFSTWPEMVDNVIPYISGEEEKSEKEPLKIWGEIENGKLHTAKSPQISAVCVRVPVSNGHMASVSVSFKKRPTKKQIINAIEKFKNPIADLNLPSAPKKLLQYCEENDYPQTRLHRDMQHGMGISMGRLREDTFFDWKFIALAHNTIRGAAGGAVLLAELLVKRGYVLS